MENVLEIKNIYGKDAFTRQDEAEDRVFYSPDRFVDHLDTTALASVSKIIENLIVEPSPVILDQMAGWNSHLPLTLRPSRVYGLGLNEQELGQNVALDDRIIHDLNIDPRLPFEDDTFDVVLNTVSVDYLTRPFEVFSETARILKPGGLYLVIFSNRMFPQKAVKVWRDASEEERIMIVQDYFRHEPLFTSTRVFVSRGLPRPVDDKYAEYGIPSDPVYAVYAEKRGPEDREWRRPEIRLDFELPMIPDPLTLAARKKRVHQTLVCPYCGEHLKKWTVPQSPFTEWDNEFMYICFNDSCSYMLRGWKAMHEQGNFGLSYRLQYNPLNDSFSPVPIPSLSAFRESIVED